MQFMKTCDTCEFWEFDPDGMNYRAAWLIYPEDPDTGEPMELPFEVRRCECPRLLFCERPVEDDGACVVDGSQYFAGLITAPKFGCVFHKEGPNDKATQDDNRGSGQQASAHARNA